MANMGMQGHNGKGSADSAIGWIFLFIALAAIFAIVWYFFQDQMKDALRWVRYAELWLLSFFYGDDYLAKSVINGNLYSLREYINVDVNSIPASRLGGDIFAYWSRVAFEPMRLFTMGLIMSIGTWALFKGPGSQYRKKHSLDTLLEMQSKVFPVISPFVDFNPSDLPNRPPGAPVPAKLQLFSEALTPEEWLAYNQIPVPDGKIDEHVAFIAFARQLGPRWQGPAKMAPYKQILLATFCLKASRKREDAEDMLGRVSKCWDHKKGLVLSRDKKLKGDAVKVLQNKKLSGDTLAVCNQHAFQNTALIRALEYARSEGGVLAPAQFVWLRGYDRALWYPLNNLGRQVFHMEALGVMSHYKTEKRTKRPIPKPKVEDAVTSIVEYMGSDKAHAIPALDYSSVKNKKGIKKPKGAGQKTAMNTKKIKAKKIKAKTKKVKNNG